MEQELVFEVGSTNVWLVDLKVAKEDWSSLSVVERRRADNFGTESLRARFVARRSALRRLLGERLGQLPREVQIHSSPFGKPYLLGSSLFFSCSSRGCAALIGITEDAELGVDIEKIQPDFPWRGLMDEHFGPSEHPALTNHEPILMWRAWTAKEACAKAIGEGFSRPFAGIEVLAEGGEPTLRSKVLIADQGCLDLFEVPISGPLVGAVAVRRPPES